MALKLLSGGAAQALVEKVSQQKGVQVEATFGAVGAMRDKLLAGAPCDLVILSQALVDQLARDGHVDADTRTPLGVVMTGVAVKAGQPAPDIGNADALRATLRAASGIYFPDPQKATAGIHFMKVLQALGVDGELANRIHNYPNGATSMHEMAQAEGNPIGCTQVTEILYTQGVQLVGLLPKEFELATVYTAAVCTKAADASAARAFIAQLASEEAADLRRTCGFS